jgi:hypothetical protein
VRLRSFASALAVLWSIFALPTSAQQASTGATQNPQAVALLTQSLNAMGGVAAISAIQDYTGTGTITYNWANQPVQAEAKVQSMGVNTLRIDSNLNNGTQTWAIDGMAGVFIAPSGTRRNAPVYNLAITGGLTFPALRLLSILQSASTSVTYVGQVTRNGSTAYQVHCVLPISPSAPPAPNLPAFGAFDLYIDATSLLVVSLQETAYSETNFQVSFPHEIDFSNYQTVGGVAVPFAITESIGGQQTWSLSLTGLSFNSGLTEAVFTP